MTTPRTQKLIDSQGQDLFYSGTPENLSKILWSQIKEWEEHAQTLERELIAKEKQIADLESKLSWLADNHQNARRDGLMIEAATM